MTKSHPARFGNGQPARVPASDADGRYIFRERTRCTKCGSDSILIYKTMPREADGSIRRYARCGECLACYIVVEE